MGPLKSRALTLAAPVCNGYWPYRYLAKARKTYGFGQPQRYTFHYGGVVAKT